MFPQSHRHFESQHSHGRRVEEAWVVGDTNPHASIHVRKDRHQMKSVFIIQHQTALLGWVGAKVVAILVINLSYW